MRTEDFPNSLWTRLLHPDAVHGVRDAAAAAALKKAGFTAVVTGCPSLLDVPRALGSADPDCAVVTVTAYAPDIQRDQALLEWVRDRFRTVYLQPQGPHDVQYAIERLAVAPSEVLPNTLDGYTAFLIQRRPTYVGTRLHGGIRALQLGLPAVILAVDDRAPGLGTPFSLPIAHTVGEINDVLSRLRCQGAETINTTLVIDRITSFLGSLKSLLGSEKLTHPEAP
jgi:polysaccharide pyruvyl transferase WcaK-like protein